MKPPALISFTVFLAAIHIGPSNSNDDSQGEANQNNIGYPNYVYGEDYHYPENIYHYDGTSDYSVVEGQKLSINCYVCNFHYKPNHVSGNNQCNDPFDGTSVPSLIGKGPCGKHLVKLPDGEYVLYRGHMENCKDEPETEKGYKQCCSTDLCNSASLPSYCVICSMLCALLTLFLEHLQR